MKYPVVSNMVSVVSKEDDTYHLYNNLTDISLVMDAEDYAFFIKLDGKTDPYSISPYREDVAEFLDYLYSERLIRSHRFETDSLLFLFSIWTPKTKGWLEKNASILNDCLIYMAPTSLLFGILLWETSTDFSIVSGWMGWILGTVIGVFFHEIGHCIAVLAYGGKVYEIGLGIAYLMPLAYTAMDANRIRGRLKRIQVSLAGLEMNILLIGIFMMLSRIHPSFALETAAMTNVFLVVMNLVGNVVVDGFDVIVDLLGIKIEGELSFKSLFSLPDVSLKGIQKWAFYINMIAVIITHMISVLLILSTIWEVLFG